jgi:CRP-like cAMP-binding protein
VDPGRLAELSALAELPEDELDAIARMAADREFDTGDTLMSEGDFGYCVFILVEGSADVVAHDEKIAEVGPGDFVGEVAVLEGRRTASVVATSPVQAISLFKRDVWALETDAPEAARRLRAAMQAHVAPD